MPLYLEKIFTIVSIGLSILGIVFGSKALINIKRSYNQKNLQGDNFQNSTINNGITAEELINIIRNLPVNDIARIVNEINIRINGLEQEIKSKPNIHIGKNAPENPKAGDIWISE